MSKTTISVVLCLICGFIGLCFAGFCFRGQSVPVLNQPFLSSYNIEGKNIPRKNNKGCFVSGTPTWIKDMDFLYHLSRVNADNIVAVIEGKKNGTAILNPRHMFGRKQYFYGPIPESQNLTKSDLDALFGSAEKQEKNELTYKLKTNHPSMPKTDKKIVYVDFKLERNKLHQFRLRSDELKSTDWVKVKKEGEET